MPTTDSEAVFKADLLDVVVGPSDGQILAIVNWITNNGIVGGDIRNRICEVAPRFHVER